eukprot:scaffold34524_cov73-Cyclotella_meneghiniana.AAC.4
MGVPWSGLLCELPTAPQRVGSHKATDIKKSGGSKYKYKNPFLSDEGFRIQSSGIRDIPLVKCQTLFVQQINEKYDLLPDEDVDLYQSRKHKSHIEKNEAESSVNTNMPANSPDLRLLLLQQHVTKNANKLIICRAILLQQGHVGLGYEFIIQRKTSWILEAQSET